MKVILGEVWLEYFDLLNVGVKEDTIKKGSYRKSPQWQTIKDSTDKRRSLIRYNTLRQSYKDLVKTQLCYGLEPYEWLKLANHPSSKVFHGLKGEFGNAEITAIAKICKVSHNAVYEAIELGFTLKPRVIDVAYDYYLNREKLVNKLLNKYRNAGK